MTLVYYIFKIIIKSIFQFQSEVNERRVVPVQTPTKRTKVGLPDLLFTLLYSHFHSNFILSVLDAGY